MATPSHTRSLESSASANPIWRNPSSRNCQTCRRRSKPVPNRATMRNVSNDNSRTNGAMWARQPQEGLVLSFSMQHHWRHHLSLLLQEPWW
ncbi:hypothetical protein DPMN_113025 [Dreissena polymorpha]|uniref:Uncharacterized protein n=1 Tax=Dreissena polymorpha TaxID=45954 RepID=A0A9D4QQK0_DREPO|nr:hypothetical protein DPMN_113025 [Dreissena polymorpha]